MWIAVTLLATVLQTARNATQAGLVAQVGTLAAAQVRFLFGLPFALAALGLMAIDGPIPVPGLRALAFAAGGAVAQIAATALLLAGMRLRSFATATALSKAEPVFLALIGALVLGDRLGPGQMLAIAIATAGTVLVSLRSRARDGATEGADPGGRSGADLRILALGLGAGLLFGLSAIGFRGAILALPSGTGLTRATTILALTLGLQAGLSLLWLVVVDRRAGAAILRAWPPSLAAGALGAAASQFWFLGFALTSAANVRTLALVEVILAQIVSRRIFAERLSRRERLGMALILLGVAVLLMHEGSAGGGS